jgi:glycosyltransferase involved in cell wall biosynthesis
VRQLANQHSSLEDVFREAPRLIAPANLHRVGLTPFRVERGGLFSGQLWEQLDLPRLARSDLVLNLCNLGPMVSRAAITMIHDAQVFITPDSYTWAFAKFYRKVLPVLGRRHARILTVSEYSASQLVRFGVAQRENIAVIHNGVDHVLFEDSQPDILKRLALEPRKFVVGLANVQVHKNIAILLRAFAAPALADLKLILVGSGRRENFERLGQATSANVVFAGRVSDGELRALLESALCVGVPSTTEGFGLLPLEAMILGCPAIVAPCGALIEIGGTSALFAAADDPREWITAIRQLADDQDHWIGCSRAGQDRARFFTWKRAGERLVTVVREVAMAEIFEKQ